ncbi:MAG: hypothetical protein ACRDID_11575, partial [Ktedonobacterales bacterium]
GADLALISHTLTAQRSAIARARAALAAGELPAERVRQAAERVRRLKQRWLAWDRLPAPVTTATVSAAAHRRLCERAYQRAVTLIRDDAGLLPARLPAQASVLVIAQPPAHVSQASDRRYDHASLVASVQRRHANSHGVVVGRGAGKTSLTAALELARGADLLILATLDASRDERQASLIRRLVGVGRPIIALAASAPYDAATFAELPTWLTAYEYTPAALNAAVDAIFGLFEAQGRLPIEAPTRSTSL